jgi:2-iminobutanoate/2-iminopropanoate deaminase
MRIVSTERAPRPAGHYSQAVVHDGLAWVAGQLPIDPAAPDAPPGDPETQIRRALHNVAAILEAAGTDLAHLLQVTIFVSDPSLWGDVNRVFAELLGEHRPARAIIPSGELKRGYLLEITAVAVVPPAPAG